MSSIEISGGNTHFMCLALVLEPECPTHTNVEEKDELGSMLSMMRQMMGRLKLPDSLREAILSQGAKAFQVLSCIEWNLLGFEETSNKVRSYMSESDFKVHCNHYVSVFEDRWLVSCRKGSPTAQGSAGSVATL